MSQSGRGESARRLTRGESRAGTGCEHTKQPADSKEDRWRSFSIAEVKGRDFKLDSFKWLKEESLEDADDLPEPEELATDAIAELEGAVEELNAVLALLENENGAGSMKARASKA